MDSRRRSNEWLAPLLLTKCSKTLVSHYPKSLAAFTVYDTVQIYSPKCRLPRFYYRFRNKSFLEMHTANQSIANLQWKTKHKTKSSAFYYWIPLSFIYHLCMRLCARQNTNHRVHVLCLMVICSTKRHLARFRFCCGKWMSGNIWNIPFWMLKIAMVSILFQTNMLKWHVNHSEQNRNVPNSELD